MNLIMQRKYERGPSVSPLIRGFSLLEVLMVTVMMAIIIFGLYAMFNQTQKSFRSNNAQVAIMSTARATLDMVTRDLQLLSASGIENGANFLTYLSYPNDYAMNSRYGLQNPILQAMVPGDTNGPYRTNFMQNLFFLQKQSNYWLPCGYFLGAAKSVTNGGATNAVLTVGSNGVASLYRVGFTLLNEFGKEAPSVQYDTNMAYIWMDQFWGNNAGGNLGYYQTNVNLLAEGVIHFAIRCYDNQGQLIEYDNYFRPDDEDWDRVYQYSAGIWRTNLAPQEDFNIYAPDAGYTTMEDMIDTYLRRDGLWQVNSQLLFPTNGVDLSTNLVILGTLIGSGKKMAVTDNLFLESALPSYVEVELGLLEPQAMEVLNAIPNPDAQRLYLLRNSGRVHLFRKRIPIQMAL